VEQIRREVVGALTGGDSIADIFQKHGIEYSTFSGISMSNAEEKEIEQIYQTAVASVKPGERIKLLATGDDEVLLLVVTAKRPPAQDSISKEHFDTAKNILRNLQKNYFLMDFLGNQMTKAAK
jgi:hypothetical protein